MMLSGWGRYPREECAVSRPVSEDDLRTLVAKGPLIARGNGRGYGDCAQNRGATVDMRRFNHMLAFDPASGQIIVEAGVLLSDIIETFLPRGWFPAVTPGTKFVTVGGMVAADVHGKNHHRDGSFGMFIDWLDVLGSDGAVKRCSAQQDAELFHWTIGGMGLTGVIVRVAFRLRRIESGWIRQQILPAANLDAAMRLFDENDSATYSVAWIDCLARGRALGRSAIMLGEHAAADELPPSRRSAPFATPRRKMRGVPVDAPSALLNRLTVRAFNAAYYHRQMMRTGEQLVDWDSYFYPLDAMANWNRIYGARGFMQFQCVLPTDSARAGLTELLNSIGESGLGSFLAVLKRMGPGREGCFSFPLDGYTLALDFPVSPRTLDLMTRLDAIVLAHGGRFYLAKDSRMSAETLRRSDARTSDFIAARRAHATAAFQSSQSKRLQL